MTFNRSKLSPINIRLFGIWSLASGLLFAASPHSASAQSPPPASTPAPKQAFVRFWNMLPGRGDSLELLLTDNKPLMTADPSNYNSDYTAILPGSYNLTVRRPTDQVNPLKHFPINLPADSYLTILASMKDGKPAVEAINDTIDPKVSNTGRLVVRQFVPGAHVSVSVGNVAPSGTLNAGDTTVLDNLPAVQSSVNVRAVFDKGTSKTWTVPANFFTSRHMDLMIVMDNYGRFRPRAVVDGQLDTASSADSR